MYSHLNEELKTNIIKFEADEAFNGQIAVEKYKINKSKNC